MSTPGDFCKVTDTGSINVSNATLTLISFNNVVVDDGMFNSPYFIITKTAGLYAIFATVQWGTSIGSSSGIKYIRLIAGSNNIKNEITGTVTYSNVHYPTSDVYTELYLAAGTSVYVYVYQSTGGNLPTITGSISLTVRRIT